MKVAITQGDTNGVGLEIAIKAIAAEGMTELMTPVVFANRHLFQQTLARLKGEISMKYFIADSPADIKEGKINVVNVGTSPIEPLYGEPTPEGGRAALESLEAAVDALEEGLVDVLVTAPINKHAIQSEHFSFPGHTEYLEARLSDDDCDDQSDSASDESAHPALSESSEKAIDSLAEKIADATDSALDLSDVELTLEESREDAEAGQSAQGASAEKHSAKKDQPAPEKSRSYTSAKAQMILFSDDMRVALLTTHLPVSEVSGAVKRPAIEDAVRRFDRTLRRDFACDRPRIAVLGLNPHNGDNGLMGVEEVEEIIPALRALQEDGVLAFGPYAADGFFGSGAWKNFDGILAMYHDQGLAPFKALAGAEGVNFTSGLEYIRTSPDHGTAYEIAGEMIADPTSMRQAIYKAIDIYRMRRRFDKMSAHPLKTK